MRCVLGVLWTYSELEMYVHIMQKLQKRIYYGKSMLQGGNTINIFSLRQRRLKKNITPDALV